MPINILLSSLNIAVTIFGGLLLLKHVRSENKRHQKKLQAIINAELQDFFSNVWLNETTAASFDTEEIEDAEILEEDLEELENSINKKSTENDQNLDENDDFQPFSKSKIEKMH